MIDGPPPIFVTQPPPPSTGGTPTIAICESPGPQLIQTPTSIGGMPVVGGVEQPVTPVTVQLTTETPSTTLTPDVTPSPSPSPDPATLAQQQTEQRQAILAQLQAAVQGLPPGSVPQWAVDIIQSPSSGLIDYLQVANTLGVHLVTQTPTVLSPQQQTLS